MRIEVVTLFPEFVAQAVRVGVLGRAIEAGRVAVQATTPREFATDVHRTVDDRPYGGGPGMVLKVEPARTAIRAAKARLPAGSRSVYLAADGGRPTQALAHELAQLRGLMLLAGRYEGVDERLIESEIDASVWIGHYVLSCGELPALVAVDTLVRLLPGVHAWASVRGARGAGSARERHPRRDPALAHQAGARPYLAAAAGADREAD